MKLDTQVSFSEKRQAIRVNTPARSRALFKSDGILERTSIRDISSAGMLIVSPNERSGYALDSTIDDIVIGIHKDKSSTNKPICFFIHQGKIVRSFFDEGSKNYCYGVEFSYDSIYMKQKIEKFVDDATSEQFSACN